VHSFGMRGERRGERGEGRGGGYVKLVYGGGGWSTGGEGTSLPEEHRGRGYTKVQCGLWTQIYLRSTGGRGHR
jgi:hypothetical protein